MIWLKPWLGLPIVAVAFLLANAQKCAVCPTGGAWTDWEEVGECSGFCGYMGRQNETRNCVSERYGCPCDGPSSRLIPCNRTLCLFPLHRCADGYKVGGPIDKLWVCVPIDPPTPDPLESQVPDPDWECTEFYNYYDHDHDHDHDHDFYYHHFNDDDYDNDDNNYYEYDYYHYHDDDDDHDYDDDDHDNNEYDYYDDVDKYYCNNHHYDADYHDDHDDHEDHDDHDDYYHYDNDDDEDNCYDYDHNNNNFYYYYDDFNDSDNYEKTLLPDHVRTRADVEGVWLPDASTHFVYNAGSDWDPALEENCYNPYNTTIQCTANMNLMATQKLYDKDRNVVRTLNYCTGANKAATIYCQRASGNSNNYYILQQDQKSIGYFSCDVAWSAECA
ncbi:unnamed protein product, partial [Mesorhabditis spiculigera]